MHLNADRSLIAMEFEFRKCINCLLTGSKIMLMQIKVLRPISSFQITFVDECSKLPFQCLGLNPAFEFPGSSLVVPSSADAAGWSS